MNFQEIVLFNRSGLREKFLHYAFCIEKCSKDKTAN